MTPVPADGTVVGIGIDVVDVDRLRAALDRRDRLAERLFTPSERAAADGHADPVPHLATWFAAKESVMKALGRGIDAVSFVDIELSVDTGSVVAVRLGGRAAARAEEVGARRWHVSVSSTERLAQAVAVAST